MLCRFWHSHTYEVTSGQLVADRLPSAVENIEMQKLVREMMGHTMLCSLKLI